MASVHTADARQDRAAAPGTGLSGPAAELCAYLTALKHAYHRDTGTTVPSAVAAQRAAELQLAEAAVRLVRPSANGVATRPAQLVVLGPTQTGKSTVVNLLLGRAAAAVSPLAGFTVHAHGFATSADLLGDAWTDALFPGWPRRRAAEMDRAELEAYSLEVVGQEANSATGTSGGLHQEPGLSPELPPCVVWDTPDFDSLAWYKYHRGVLEAVALADLLVLVLSREKYADLAVWRMLRLIEPLGRPLIVVLNKMTPDAQETIAASLRERLAETSDSWRDAPICPLPYSPGSAWPPDEAIRAAAHGLRRAVAESLPAAARRPARPGVARLLRRNWQTWAEPVAAERAASLAWRELVEGVVAEVLEAYKRDFLEHPQRYDTFRRATVELLHLLELPGVAGVVHEVRRVVTWPARQLFAAGREWWRSRRPDPARRRLVGEELVLHEIIDHVLVRLQRDCSRRAVAGSVGAGFWRALVRRIEREEARLRVRFQQAAEDHRREFEGEVRAAAERMYRALQDSPVLLGGLRAARASADVAAVVLAIKTGGAPLHDLLLAPAMLAVSSLLTEGALGGYVHRVAEELKRRQFERVRHTLVQGVFEYELNALAEGLSDDELFGVRFEQWQRATEALDQWESAGPAGAGIA